MSTPPQSDPTTLTASTVPTVSTFRPRIRPAPDVETATGHQKTRRATTETSSDAERDESQPSRRGDGGRGRRWGWVVGGGGASVLTDHGVSNLTEHSRRVTARCRADTAVTRRADTVMDELVSGLREPHARAASNNSGWRMGGGRVNTALSADEGEGNQKGTGSSGGEREG